MTETESAILMRRSYRAARIRRAARVILNAVAAYEPHQDQARAHRAMVDCLEDSIVTLSPEAAPGRPEIEQAERDIEDVARAFSGLINEDVRRATSPVDG